MEYLMTYGWAVLVVIVAGIVMWQLGTFNFEGQTSTTSTGFPRIKPQLTLMRVNESGYFIGTFTNGAGGPIVLNYVSCEGIPVTVPAGTVSYGENFDVSGSCGLTGKRGDPYNLDIVISYNVTLKERTNTHTDQGRLIGPIE
jgi:hypothetical protein